MRAACRRIEARPFGTAHSGGRVQLEPEIVVQMARGMFLYDEREILALLPRDAPAGSGVVLKLRFLR